MTTTSAIAITGVTIGVQMVDRTTEPRQLGRGLIEYRPLPVAAWPLTTADIESRAAAKLADYPPPAAGWTRRDVIWAVSQAGETYAAETGRYAFMGVETAAEQADARSAALDD